MDFGLKQKKAVVCGASKGLGLAISHALAAEGCELLMCARDEKTLKQAAQEIETTHKCSPRILCKDLSKPEEVNHFARTLQESFWPVDILINNVGGPPPSAAATTSFAAWQQGFEQIFLSAALLSQAAAEGMKKQQFGRIITITSLSVVEPIDHLAVSTTMRAAVTTFTKTLSKEMAPFGVTVNTVMPGIIETGRIIDLRQAKAQRDGTTLDLELAKTRAHIPMGRMGKPAELAALVSFLASTQASYITGANIPVDGGLRSSWA